MYQKGMREIKLCVGRFFSFLQLSCCVSLCCTYPHTHLIISYFPRHTRALLHCKTLITPCMIYCSGALLFLWVLYVNNKRLKKKRSLFVVVLFVCNGYSLSSVFSFIYVCSVVCTCVYVCVCTCVCACVCVCWHACMIYAKLISLFSFPSIPPHLPHRHTLELRLRQIFFLCLSVSLYFVCFTAPTRCERQYA